MAKKEEQKKGAKAPEKGAKAPEPAKGTAKAPAKGQKKK
jgi:hypothetical protein